MKKWVVLGVQAIALVLLLSIIAGAVLGQPILLSFVETGSMEPTLDAGDGFIAIPSAISGDVSEGDVVVFEAEEIEGGGLTTHRIVDETDRGYVTQGDANPFTDQDSNEPPVQDAQIVATALQIDSSVVAIPQLGTAVLAAQSTVDDLQRWLAVTFGTRLFLGTQGLAFVLLALSIVLFVADVIRERTSRSTNVDARSYDRSRTRSAVPRFRLFAIGCAAVLVLAASAAMLLPAGTTELGIVSAEFSAESPTTIEQGTTGEIPYGLENDGVLPVVTYLDAETEGMETTPEQAELGPRSTAAASIHVEAPDETGFYRYYVTEYRYLAILPSGVIDWLYNRHPLAPFVGINAIIGGGTYLVARTLGPNRRVRHNRSNRSTNTKQ